VVVVVVVVVVVAAAVEAKEAMARAHASLTVLS
jgi:hypothetical protein